MATTTHESDDLVISLCAELGIKYFRGSEHDVLDRYYYAAKSLGLNGNSLNGNDTVVRITGDCPLIDAKICDAVISLLKHSDADYVSNTIVCTFPDGLDCEAMKFEALEKSWKEAKLKYEREHVTQYILKHEDLFVLKNFPCNRDLSSMRWTLDNPEDYIFIKAVVEGMGESKRGEDAEWVGKDDFDMNDILCFLENNPELIEINSSITRNEGLKKSIQEENL